VEPEAVVLDRLARYLSALYRGWANSLAAEARGAARSAAAAAARDGGASSGQVDHEAVLRITSFRGAVARALAKLRADNAPALAAAGATEAAVADARGALGGQLVVPAIGGAARGGAEI